MLSFLSQWQTFLITLLCLPLTAILAFAICQGHLSRTHIPYQVKLLRQRLVVTWCLRTYIGLRPYMVKVYIKERINDQTTKCAGRVTGNTTYLRNDFVTEESGSLETRRWKKERNSQHFMTGSSLSSETRNFIPFLWWRCLYSTNNKNQSQKLKERKHRLSEEHDASKKFSAINTFEQKRKRLSLKEREWIK